MLSTQDAAAPALAQPEAATHNGVGSSSEIGAGGNSGPVRAPAGGLEKRTSLPNRCCGAETIASLFGLTARRVRQLVDEGVIPRPRARGEYDLEGAVRGYVRYLQTWAGRYTIRPREGGQISRKQVGPSGFGQREYALERFCDVCDFFEEAIAAVNRLEDRIKPLIGTDEAALQQLEKAIIEAHRDLCDESERRCTCGQ